MIISIPLELIADNPFQTRAAYEPAAVHELADSIRSMRDTRPETRGLIHVPPARVVDRIDTDVVVNPRIAVDGLDSALETYVYQLAAGHTRFRAFQLLAEQDPEAWGAMPLDLSTFDDRAMADIAWSENQKRKDLTAIEEALAMQRAMDEFGYTQQEIGDRWGLSRSAVANKLRLLGLPGEAKSAIQAGKLSERHGRALLSAAGKSPAVYARVAAEVIPVDVPDDVTARARALYDRGGWSRIYAYDRVKHADECTACGATEDLAYYRYNPEVETYEGLCMACYRAASGWEPPSVATSEAAVEVAVRRERCNLTVTGAPPVGVVVGRGDPAVRHDRCVDCDLVLARDDVAHYWCLDRTCYKAKQEHWYSYQATKLREHWPGQPVEIVRGHGGYDLRANDDVDAALVERGICAPGRCDKVRFRYYPYEHAGYFKPDPDLPFVYNCSHGASHAACQRRYLAEQQPADERKARAQAEAAAKDRVRQAEALRARAGIAVGRALVDRDHPGVWRALAREVTGSERAEMADVESCARVIAEHLLRRVGYFVNFENEAALAAFHMDLMTTLGKLNVGLPPGLDDLQMQLDRIRGFLLDDDEHMRPDLNPAMVRGNRDNLDKLVDAAEELARDGLATQTETSLLVAQARELADSLAAAAGVSSPAGTGEARETPEPPDREAPTGDVSRETPEPPDRDAPTAMWAPQAKNPHLAHYWTCDPTIRLWESACGQIGHGDDGNGGNWQPVEDDTLKRCRTCERAVRAREEA